MGTDSILRHPQVALRGTASLFLLLPHWLHFSDPAVAPWFEQQVVRVPVLTAEQCGSNDLI